MLCYRDMTFCIASCEEVACGRNWNLMDKTGYKEWSKGFDDGNGPVARSDFSNDCPLFKPTKGRAT